MKTSTFTRYAAALTLGSAGLLGCKSNPPQEAPRSDSNTFVSTNNFVDKGEVYALHEHSNAGVGMATYDLDGDGDLDLFTAGPLEGILYFENDGKGNFTYQRNLGETCQPLDSSVSIAVADVTGDGKPDILVAGPNGVRLYENRDFTITMVAIPRDAPKSVSLDQYASTSQPLAYRIIIFPYEGRSGPQFDAQGNPMNSAQHELSSVPASLQEIVQKLSNFPHYMRGLAKDDSILQALPDKRTARSLEGKPIEVLYVGNQPAATDYMTLEDVLRKSLDTTVDSYQITSSGKEHE